MANAGALNSASWSECQTTLIPTSSAMAEEACPCDGNKIALGQSICVHLAANRASSICINKFTDSASGATLVSNVVPAYFPAVDVRARSWTLVNVRGVSRYAIFFCSAVLILSSITNNKTVHIDSVGTPTIRHHNAMVWTVAENRGDSLGWSAKIANPTATPANTLSGTNVTWGQNGSSLPDQTALKYETIGLITILLMVWAAAFIRIIMAIVAIFKKKSAL